jgi:hypothetical protein
MLILRNSFLPFILFEKEHVTYWLLPRWAQLILVSTSFVSMCLKVPLTVINWQVMLFEKMLSSENLKELSCLSFCVCEESNLDPDYSVWRNFDTFLLQEDLYYPHPFVQDVLWATLHKFVEPVMMHWPGSKLREKALETVMQHVHYEDENTRYICIGPVNKVN